MVRTLITKNKIEGINGQLVSAQDQEQLIPKYIEGGKQHITVLLKLCILSPVRDSVA